MTSRALLWLAAALIALVIAVAIVGRAAGSDYRQLPQRELERQAQRLAGHGGVRGSCYACASQRMKVLSLELVRRAFPPAHRAWAQCIVLRESGANPGAVSATHDYGLPQIHVAAHPEYSAWRLTHDPAYSVRAFVALSRHGREREPWAGGRYAC